MESLSALEGSERSETTGPRLRESENGRGGDRGRGPDGGHTPGTRRWGQWSRHRVELVAFVPTRPNSDRQETTGVSRVNTT